MNEKIVILITILTAVVWIPAIIIILIVALIISGIGRLFGKDPFDLFSDENDPLSPEYFKEESE